MDKNWANKIVTIFKNSLSIAVELLRFFHTLKFDQVSDIFWGPAIESHIRNMKSYLLSSD